MSITSPQPLRQLPWHLSFAGYGFVYWLALLLWLEPGNWMNALQAGAQLHPGHELGRMLGAALLGASATPPLWLWIKRCSAQLHGWWRKLIMLGAGIAGTGFALIVASCLLAAWVYTHSLLPSKYELVWQLAHNWQLLSLALGIEMAVAYGWQAWPRGHSTAGVAAPAPDPVTTGAYLSRITVKLHGRQRVVSLQDVDWIESQGNYVTLHVADGSHLARYSLTALAGQLDPQHFVRVHRRALIAVNRIVDSKPLTNGDCELRLQHGHIVRASRLYKAGLQERMRYPPSASVEPAADGA